MYLKSYGTHLLSKWHNHCENSALPADEISAKVISIILLRNQSKFANLKFERIFFEYLLWNWAFKVKKNVGIVITDMYQRK